MPGNVFSFFENLFLDHNWDIFGLKFGPKSSGCTGEVVDPLIFFLFCVFLYLG